MVHTYLLYWYTGEGPEEGFWHYIADGLNPKFSSICGAGYMLGDIVKVLN